MRKTMTITENQIEDKYEISGEFFDIGVRTATVIMKDAVEISRSNHRKVLTIGDDISLESDNVKGLAALFWTDDLKAKHAEMVALQEAAGPEQVVTLETLPTDIALNRVQFKSMLAILGITIDQINIAIDGAITDATQNTIAKVKVTESELYHRNDALFSSLAPAIGLTSEQIDAAWEQALQI
jgi:hypothetical protein